MANKKPIEQYTHENKKRVNNPPVGLVTPDTDKDEGKKKYQYDPHIDPVLQFDSQRKEVEDIIDNGLEAGTLDEAKEALEELKNRQNPYLNWTGKAEHTSFELPTVSLHVHERIDPKRIIASVKKKREEDSQMSLFETQKRPLREAIEFYKHKDGWTNRLIAGDSLLVMNSLLEKEGLGGKVQMVYIDPPYGIKYGSNFQPFTNKRDVKDGKDEDLTAEPEMIKAFRDTWELGIHSYLTYIRDRLLLSRELLHESGSVFVQISNENIHFIRCILDEVFGTDNEISTIVWKKGTPVAKNIRNSFNYLLWYAKDVEKATNKIKKLYRERTGIEGTTEDPKKLALWGEFHDGTERTLTAVEKRNILSTSQQAKIFRVDKVIERGDDKERKFKFEFEGEDYTPKEGYCWRGDRNQMERLKNAGRIIKTKEGFGYKFHISDYPVIEITNLWDDTAGNIADMVYAVQTNEKISQRCILITTDPGDLVLDITCGSGTTAYVAEQWGRRWITCDTSRVAITLAKQRLMTANFDYYELAHPQEGVGSGFRYKTVPHITLKSIANNEPPQEETLYDRPFVDRKKTRVTGPFTVEAVPAPVARSIEEIEMEDTASDESVGRSGETLRQAEWRDELLKAGVRAKGGRTIEFIRVEPLSGTRYLHAEAETREDDPKRVLISFGPEYAPLEQRQVELALEEAMNLKPKCDIVLFAALQFDAEAAKDIDETNWPGVILLRAQMNADLLTDDLKKKRSSNESFWLIGQPDVEVKEIAEGGEKGKMQVEVKGFDYYNPKTGKVDSGGKADIAMWMIDTDYDGRSLFTTQVFFPMAGQKDGWSKLAKNLKTEIDEKKIESFRGTVSLPFEPGKQIAVKIIDNRGIESLKIIKL